jgi:hypothetical protein
MFAGLRLAPLELLGLEHRPPEVNEEKHRHGAGYDVVEHGRVGLLHPLAELHDRPERQESDDADREVAQVEHGGPPWRVART